MVGITELLQSDLIGIMNTLKSLQRECKNIYDSYWKTDANTNVSGLSLDTDPAAKTAKLTKKDYTDGITFCQDFNDFFNNTAVTTSDYYQILVKIQYGDADLTTPLSEATESIGDRLKQLALNCLDLYNQVLDTIDMYYDNEIGDILAVIDDDRIVYGSNMTKVELSDALTLLQQYVNMLSNSAVTTGDYSTTIGSWQRLTHNSDDLVC